MKRLTWIYLCAISLVVLLLVSPTYPFDAPLISHWKAFFALLTLSMAVRVVSSAMPSNKLRIPHMLFFFTGVLLLPPILILIQIVMIALVDWEQSRREGNPIVRDGYHLPLKMGTHLIAAFSAFLLLKLLTTAPIWVFSIGQVFNIVVAALAYALLHQAVGRGHGLLQGLDLHESGILDVDALFIKVAMLFIGYGVAIMWLANPWLLLVSLIPGLYYYQVRVIPLLKKEAYTDAKTGLSNMRHFDELFNAELVRATRSNGPLSIIMVDVDDLGIINNTYGHLAGDGALFTVSGTIRHQIEANDIAARLGGEEFAIVLPEVGSKDALELAESLRSQIEHARFETANHDAPLQTSVSIGVATFPQHGITSLELIHSADVAMYQAKLKGKNRVVFADDVRDIINQGAGHQESTEVLNYRAAFAPAQESESQAYPLAGFPTADIPVAGSEVEGRSKLGSQLPDPLQSVPASTLQASTLQASTLQASTLQASTLQASTLQASTLQASTLQTSTLQTSTLQTDATPNGGLASNGTHRAHAMDGHQASQVVRYVEMPDRPMPTAQAAQAVQVAQAVEAMPQQPEGLPVQSFSHASVQSRLTEVNEVEIDGMQVESLHTQILQADTTNTHRTRAEVQRLPPILDSAATKYQSELQAGPISSEVVASIAGAFSQPKSETAVGQIPPALVFTTFGLSFIAVCIGLYAVDSPINVLSLVVFGIVALIVQLLQHSMYESSTISVSAAIILAGTLVEGMPGLLTTCGMVVLVHSIQYQPTLTKVAYNWSTHIIAGVAPFTVYWMGITRGAGTLPLMVLFTLLSAVVYYAIESTFIATAIGLGNRQNIFTVWNGQFRWLIIHYIVAGFVALSMALAFLALGPWGVVAFAMPILLIYFAQKQYVSQTEESTNKLNRMNVKLSKANSDISIANRSFQRLTEELFLILSKIIDARDPDVHGHASQVSTYAEAISHELGLRESETEQIRRGALLHDIGKLGIPEAILNKPGPLTDSEYEIMKRHPALGAELLETCQGLRSLAPYVRHHHEWWDGKGYPSSLYQEQIPLGARILSVCDAVEAMTSDRPYRKGLSHTAVVSELEKGKGHQFDPLIVDAFIKILKTEGTDILRNSAVTS